MLYVIVRGMRIWPLNAAKCCKNAGKFFPDEIVSAKWTADWLINEASKLTNNDLL